MVSETLRTFFLSGSLGPVGPDTERAVVEATFGPADDFDAASPSPESAQIWKYGDVEIHFERDRVWLVHIDRFSGSGGTPAGSANLQLDAWVVVEGLPLDSFVAALNQAGLPYATLVEPHLDRTLVTFPSGVQVGFSGVSRENARLGFIAHPVR